MKYCRQLSESNRPFLYKEKSYEILVLSGLDGYNLIEIQWDEDHPKIIHWNEITQGKIQEQCAIIIHVIHTTERLSCI